MKNHVQLLFLSGALSVGTYASVHAQSPSIQSKNGIPFGIIKEDYSQRKAFESSVPEKKDKQAQYSQSSITLQAQSACGNLLANGYLDEENYYGYSGRQSNVSSPASSLYNSNELPYWQATNYSTPDYFNNAAPAGSLTNPASAPLGAFVPFAGPGAVGLIGTNEYQPDRPSSYKYSEQMTQVLTQPLSSSHHYYASLKACSALMAQYATSIGIYITTGDPKDFSNMSYNPNGGMGYVYAKSYTPSTPLTNPSGCGIQSPGVISSSQWTPVSGIFQGVDNATYVNVGNFRPDIKPLIRPNATSPVSYTYVDNLEVFEIPEAGPAPAVCTTGNITIGEGCDIPGATYAWTSGPYTSTFATTIQTTVNPTTTTTYTLTVTLPDRTTYASSVKVTRAPAYPIVQQYDAEGDNCYGLAHYQIINYDPTLTYTINNISSAVGIPLNPTTDRFVVKGGRAQDGIFTLTATTNCSPKITGPSTTTNQIQVAYPCDPPSGTFRTANAYPNPASETLTMPEKAEGGVLLNSHGSVVQRPDTGGKLNVRNLPAGLYNLQMRQVGKLINQRIEVKH